MSDRLDAAIHELVAELAASRLPVEILSEPSELIRVRPSPRRRWRGPLVAAAVFAALAGIGLAIYFGAHTRLPARDAASATTSPLVTGAREATVRVDGATLRGIFVPGDRTGLLVVPSYATTVADLSPLLIDLAATGHTLLSVDLRGVGASDGTTTVDLLAADIEAAMGHLRRAGVDRIVLLGYRHGATAALVAASPAAVDAVVAYFPFTQYQGLDATSAVQNSTVPTLFISDSAHVLYSRASWAHLLWQAAGGPADFKALPLVPDGADTLRFYTPLMVSHAMAFLGENLNE